MIKLYRSKRRGVRAGSSGPGLATGEISASPFFSEETGHSSAVSVTATPEPVISPASQLCAALDEMGASFTAPSFSL